MALMTAPPVSDPLTQARRSRLVWRQRRGGDQYPTQKVTFCHDNSDPKGRILPGVAKPLQEIGAAPAKTLAGLGESGRHYLIGDQLVDAHCSEMRDWAEIAGVVWIAAILPTEGPRFPRKQSFRGTTNPMNSKRFPRYPRKTHYF